MTCPICCETYNMTLRKRITCEYVSCMYDACKSCMRQYICTQENDPNCMKCHMIFSTGFVYDALNKSFMTGPYKIHRKKILLDKTLSQLPSTMPYAVLKRKTESKISEMDEARKVLKLAMIRVKTLKQELHELENTKIKKNSQVVRCPLSNCLGFLNDNNQCGLCETYSCEKCMCIKQDGHICDAGVLSTTTFIKSQTKPCPSCGERISKIDGCDQMWCITCHQAFSWNTGKLDKGVVHNPHYIQYKNTVGVNPCNPTDLPSIALRNHFYQIHKHTTIGIKIINMVQTTCIIHYELPRLQESIQKVENTIPIQVDYIMGKMNKDQLEYKLYIMDTKRMRLNHVLNVFTLLDQICLEIIWGIFNLPTEQQKQPTIICKELRKMLELFEYCNQQWLNMSVDLSFSVPWFEMVKRKGFGWDIDFCMKKPVYKEYIAQGFKQSYGNKKLPQNLLLYLE